MKDKVLKSPKFPFRATVMEREAGMSDNVWKEGILNVFFV